MIELLGRFHPLLVHLPIGILLVALLLQLLSAKARFKTLEAAIPPVLLTGAAGAFISCITGYLLSVSDDYDEALVTSHMWMGIVVTVISLLLYLQYIQAKLVFPKKITAIALFAAIMITGHLGGSLTHGANYLSEPFLAMFSNDSTVNYKILPLQNAQEAMAYKDVVKPILQTKCYTCHNAAKQKGSLRMDDSLLLMKGGKHGVVIDLKDLGESELLQRIQLPADNEKHMPPKEKPQLSESQLALVHWWINSGASFTKKVKDIPQDARIKRSLAALEQPAAPAQTLSDAGLKPVEKADEKTITALQQKGIIAETVTQRSNYLSVSFAVTGNVTAGELEGLLKLRKQIISLNISNTDINDSALAVLAQLTPLIRLNLSGTKITGKGLPVLRSLQQLQYLNITGTAITTTGLLPLKEIRSLSKIFIYQSGIPSGDYALLKANFPNTIIDTGGYRVPILAGDTTEVKYKY